MEGINFFNSN